MAASPRLSQARSKTTSADGVAIMSSEKICSVEGCNRPFSAKGYCNMHYLRMLRNGDTEPRTQLNHTGACSVEGCDRAHYAKGLCYVHYRRQRRNGSLELQRGKPEKCSIEGCEKAARAKGYCGAHYTSLRKSGSVKIYGLKQPKICSIKGCYRT